MNAVQERLQQLSDLIGNVLFLSAWKHFIDWLKELVVKVNTELQGIPHAAAMFIERIEDKLVAIRHKLYYKEDEKWTEEISTRKMLESSVPENLRMKIADTESEITEEIEAELGMEL